MTASLEVLGKSLPEAERVLTPDALRFVAALAAEFGGRRKELLAKRQERQARLDKGELPRFLVQPPEVKDPAWKVASIPRDLEDRRVEITGPVDRKMIINALNSGANVFMADFEDANSPTWENLLAGQANLQDAVRRTISFEAPGGKRYALVEKPATLMVRPRGWHLPEKHVRLGGEAISGSLFDFGLFFFHNAREQLARGTGPYFYLPKMESHLEARLWNDVFLFAQTALGVPRGAIRATVLIETLPAAFEMEEILFELREHSAGLNCGRWDYIFSFIKKLAAHREFLLPDRALVTMDKAFLKAYVERLIPICHRRGAHAMGGMAAQIPIKNDPAANEAALAKVRADKLREVKSGHDGTWVAHPALVPIAKEIFDAHLRAPNQIGAKREDREITEQDLLEVPPGERTEEGLRHNVRVGVQYLAAWMDGQGCVPLYNLMEDAATAEIARAQVWQWIRHGAALADGRTVTAPLFTALLEEERKKLPPSRRLDEAAALFSQLSTAQAFADFLTLPAYERL